MIIITYVLFYFGKNADALLRIYVMIDVFLFGDNRSDAFFVRQLLLAHFFIALFRKAPIVAIQTKRRKQYGFHTVFFL